MSMYIHFIMAIELFTYVFLFVFIFNEETSSNNNPSKEIPSLHLDRFSGPSMKFVFW